MNDETRGGITVTEDPTWHHTRIDVRPEAGDEAAAVATMVAILRDKALAAFSAEAFDTEARAAGGPEWHCESRGGLDGFGRACLGLMTMPGKWSWWVGAAAWIGTQKTSLTIRREVGGGCYVSWLCWSRGGEDASGEAIRIARRACAGEAVG